MKMKLAVTMAVMVALLAPAAEASKRVTMAQVRAAASTAQRLQDDMTAHVLRVPVGGTRYYSWMRSWYKRDRAIQSRVRRLLQDSPPAGGGWTQQTLVLMNLDTWETCAYLAVSGYSSDPSDSEVRHDMRDAAGAMRAAWRALRPDWKRHEPATLIYQRE